ncbi:MAG: class I adenylate-forming enzyme family protein, partial [bacterium]
RNRPDRRAFISGRASITFSELSLSSDGFASSLHSIGINKGKHVLLLIPNSIEFVISFYGTVKAGGTVASLNHLVREAELSKAVNETEPEAAVIPGSLPPAERALLDRSGITTIEVGEPTHEKAITFFDFISKGAGPICPSVGPNDPAVIQYTGATTGAPKPAVMSSFNLVANAMQNATWFGWDENDRVMGVLPLCHTWGCSCCMNSPIYAGATSILMERFDPELVLQTIQSERATVLYGSATMFAMLLNYPRIESHDLSSLRWVKAGAMPIPLELKRKWDEKTGIPMVLGYGLTEASPETHDSPPGRIREGTIGIPIVDTDARIVDPETGGELGYGEPGELLIRGPQVTTFGYLNDEQETGRALAGGWLHTGDIAMMDGEGYFTLVDRKKDIIKCKGYTIYPVELEDVLYKHPGVKECAVVAREHAEWGEIPKAFIVCKEGSPLTEEEVLQFCEKRVAPYKKIREVEFVGELPRTPVGKVLRRKLRRDR